MDRRRRRPARRAAIGRRRSRARPATAAAARSRRSPTPRSCSAISIRPTSPAAALKLDPALAHRAIEEHDRAAARALASREAALGIHRVVNVQMAEGIRLVSISRGVDPRGFALMPLRRRRRAARHRAGRASSASRPIVVPRYPGVLSRGGTAVRARSSTRSRRPSSAASRRSSTVDVHADACARPRPRCAALMRSEGVATGRRADPLLRRRLLRRPVVLDRRSPLDLGAAPTRSMRLYRGTFVAAHDQRLRPQHPRAGAHRQPARRAARAGRQRRATATAVVAARRSATRASAMIVSGWRAATRRRRAIYDARWRSPAGLHHRGPGDRRATGHHDAGRAGLAGAIAAGGTHDHDETRSERHHAERRDARIDPITLEVVRNKLEGIANEMQATLLFSAVLADREGSDGLLGGAVHGRRADDRAGHRHPDPPRDDDPGVARRHRRVSGRRRCSHGDVYILNDPYCGGTHLPDITAVHAGVRRRPAHRASARRLSHHQDVGGMSPGSMPTNATEIYQEGLRIPPLKLHRGGRDQRHAACSMLRYNIRIPDTFTGDLNAQLAACTVGARRLVELCATAWPRHAGSDLRAAARPVGGDDARRAAHVAGGHVPLRRLPRQRRRRARPPSAHRGRGHGRATARSISTSPAPIASCAVRSTACRRARRRRRTTRCAR